jgi:hypothetical protein
VIPVVLPRNKERRETATFQCVTCLQLFRVRFFKHKRSCVDCEDLRQKAKEAAVRKIKAEIKAGRMPPAATHKCVDCGEPASMYDHRDYSKPLEVSPVCRSCNWERGPARVYV